MGQTLRQQKRKAPSRGSVVSNYLSSLARSSGMGDATEESFYPCLQKLIEQGARVIGRKVSVTSKPRRTEAGNPDFRVWDLSSRSVIGYIEAKPIGTDLAGIEKTEQLQRYIRTFPNVILTNFLDFWLYRNGQLVAAIQIAVPHALKNTRLRRSADVEGFFDILEQYLDFSVPGISEPSMLATELAKRARLLREEVLRILRDGTDSRMQGFHDAFRRYLIHDLSEEDFADLYAQTVCYVLFAARTRHSSGEFNRKTAFSSIPDGLGVLNDMFRFICLESIPEEMEWIVDDITTVLASTDVFAMMDRYYHEHSGEDPVVYFYETFLAEYDPEERKRRGVYYTPKPVVSFIVRSVNQILKEKFNKPLGLASDGVTILDPAAGTMAFPAVAAELAMDEFVSAYGEGGLQSFIRDHILKNFYGFELMVAPYTIGHIKMSFVLEERGYRMKKGERVQLYLTNTLDMSETEEILIPGLSALSKESRKANFIKKEQPILVILGNPPYSVSSVNRGEWIINLVKDYKFLDGEPVRERTWNAINDDYVKFIRFAQWKIENSGRGVVAFVTNHGFLENPTFRGMRWSLMQTFDEIYVLDLHGNSRRRDTSPDGSKDENVFDIQAGVCVVFMIKTSDRKECEVYKSDLWGTRESKYSMLSSGDWKSWSWKRIKPESPFYVFEDLPESSVWSRSKPLSDFFIFQNSGIKTGKDSFTVSFTEEEMWSKILDLVNLSEEIIRKKYGLGRDRKWVLSKARSRVKATGPTRKRVVRYYYRPFDVRFTYLADGFLDTPHLQFCKQVLVPSNLILTSVRRIETGRPCSYAHIARHVCDLHLTVKETSYAFPLYIKDKDGSIVSNIRQEVLDELSGKYGTAVTPEEVFRYIYGLLNAPAYREKFDFFLRYEFPHVPFPDCYEDFQRLAEIGRKLIDLHTLESPELRRPGVHLSGTGTPVVQKVQYEDGKVHIGGDFYFSPVSPEVWEFEIGGYRPARNWLKARKGRELTLEDVRTYCSIVAAISRTIELQKELDEAVRGAFNW